MNKPYIPSDTGNATFMQHQMDPNEYNGKTHRISRSVLTMSL